MRFLILLTLVAAASAQWPGMSDQYTATTTITMSTMPTAMSMNQWVDIPNGRTRSDTVTPYYTVESLTIASGATQNVYSIMMGTCHYSTVPYVAPNTTYPCAPTKVAGTACPTGSPVASCDQYDMTCGMGGSNGTIDFYFASGSSTPVAMVTSIPAQHMTTTIIYNTYTAGVPDASKFAVPAGCTSPKKAFAEAPAAPHKVHTLLQEVMGQLKSVGAHF